MPAIAAWVGRMSSEQETEKKTHQFHGTSQAAHIFFAQPKEHNKNPFVAAKLLLLQELMSRDLPVGRHFGFSVKPRCEKYFSLSEIESVLMVASFRADRGAYRDRHEAWCGMRWTCWLASDDGRPRRTSEIVWSRPPDAEVKRIARRFAGATVTKKPGTPRRARISREPSRRECRCSGVPAAFSFCALPRVRLVHPVLPAPSEFQRDTIRHHPDAIAPRGCEVVAPILSRPILRDAAYAAPQDEEKQAARIRPSW